MSRRVRRATATGIVAVALLGGVVSAHQPWFNLDGSPDPQDPHVLGDLETSQVVYGGLGEPGRVDWYAFAIEEPWRASFGIVVPEIAPCEEFRPVLVLVGHGDAAASDLPEALRVDGTPVADQVGMAGGMTVATLEEWGEFYEPYSGVNYATGPDLEVELPAGEYLLAVVEPDGDAGTYGLTLGGAEVRGGDSADAATWGAVLQCEPPPVATPAPDA